MAHTITAYSKVQKVKEEPKFEVTNRKERRRVNSKKKGMNEWYLSQFKLLSN